MVLIMLMEMISSRIDYNGHSGSQNSDSRGGGDEMMEVLDMVVVEMNEVVCSGNLVLPMVMVEQLLVGNVKPLGRSMYFHKLDNPKFSGNIAHEK